jgi:hypothetical protein
LEQYPVQGIHVDLESLSWLCGAWVGTRGEDRAEVHYSAPNGTQSIMGMFRWIRDGKVRFFEFVTLENVQQGLMYRIKHFHPGLVGWEEKSESVAFLLVETGEREAVFYSQGKTDPLWLILRRTSETEFVEFFEKQKGKHDPQEEFRYNESKLDFSGSP